MLIFTILEKVLQTADRVPVRAFHAAPFASLRSIRRLIAP
jgi:hypothetical protein